MFVTGVEGEGTGTGIGIAGGGGGVGRLHRVLHLGRIGCHGFEVIDHGQLEVVELGGGFGLGLGFGFGGCVWG